MKKIILLISFILILSGCYDYKELNDMSIVSGIGIDFIDDEYIVSLEITKSSKDGSSTEIETNVVTGNDSNISNAFNKAMNMTDKEVYLEHVELLIISTELAEYGISDVFDYIVRDTTINSNYFVVVGDNPKELLSTTIENKSMSQVIVDTVSYTQGDTSIDDLDIMASKFITNKEDIALPYVSSDDNSINYSDIIYFNGDKMVGKINNKMYSFLVLDTKDILFTRNNNTIKIYNKKISMEVKDNIIEVNIKVDGQISKINKDVNLKDEDSYSKLEKLMNKEIEEETILFIDTILDNDSDLLGFKNIYYKKYKKNINSFKYKVNVSTTINKNGTIYEVLDDN